MKKVILKTPEKEELGYRKKWLSNSETMSYNAGYDIEVEGYDKNSGTIRKTENQLEAWYHSWKESEGKYYAYIYDAESKQPVGEIYYRYQENMDEYEVGIVIASEYRGVGFGYFALLELERIAFEEKGLKALSDWFPEERLSAVNLFQKAGFAATEDCRDEIVFGLHRTARKFLLTKENYESRKKKEL